MEYLSSIGAFFLGIGTSMAYFYYITPVGDFEDDPRFPPPDEEPDLCTSVVAAAHK